MNQVHAAFEEAFTAAWWTFSMYDPELSAEDNAAANAD